FGDLGPGARGSPRGAHHRGGDRHHDLAGHQAARVLPGGDPLGGGAGEPASSKGVGPMSRETEQELLAQVATGLRIGGEWVATAATFPVKDPATGDTLLEIADAGPEESVRALDAAVAAQEAWAATPPRTRSDILRRAFALVQEH